MRKLLVLGLALALAGCVVVQDPTLAPARVFDARPLIPEGWYERMYHMMATCTGKSRPYSEIQWFIVEADGMVNERGEVAAGIWSAPNRVYLDQRYVMNGWVIRHEMAHHLMQEGDPAHEDPLFKACTSI